jgi:hypothetical protein
VARVSTVLDYALAYCAILTLAWRMLSLQPCVCLCFFCVHMCLCIWVGVCIVSHQFAMMIRSRDINLLSIACCLLSAYIFVNVSLFIRNCVDCPRKCLLIDLLRKYLDIFVDVQNCSL